jgi:uncharacterized MAPEG superfamily protein
MPGPSRRSRSSRAPSIRTWAWTRAHRNDLESTLPFLAIVSSTSGGSAGAAIQLLLIAFTALRCAFSFFYLRAMQPWRSASFMLGELCLVIMLVQILGWGFLG